MRKQLPLVPTSPLPPLYGAWMDELFAGPIPQETNATCDECAMCAPAGHRPTGSDFYFSPHVKCCSFVPELPNYLVGRILADNDPALAAGRATVQARLRAGLAVTPLGLGQSPAYTVVYDYQRERGAFGRNRSLLCPHFLDEDGGRCGIWRYREAVCTTYFCKQVRGAVGERFWRALQRLLETIEGSLARWCVLQLDVGAVALRSLFPRSVDATGLEGVVDPGVYQRLWGNWSAREEEFYQECARLVTPLTWPKVSAIGGSELEVYARLAQDAYQSLLSDELPATLRVGSFNIVRMDRDSGLVSPYSDTDPVKLPRALLDVLGYFDGRPTGKVLRTILDEEGLKLHPALVRQLVDFEILVPYPPLDEGGNQVVHVAVSGPSLDDSQ